ncbi:TonB-dependent hemoglobin/transferrin/lactoferrin family receptor [Limibaculum sp. M0105]|uniref:TonB-dependent hemoglobin/transferrin/lactoferrin family receptor n=1 Tax=Thermohalobaculum xanthum TaxID=2753746 RepID=A0A8J7SCG7_9RHOB|nr:TonB-dependent hemoglobin/transferrin/lactoferrin family receptor [Thermohalobaculum xanthum]MBK0398251.1 TonB-dependent hemoglobin/transferrin/lactoferrin family receptor [Thermohalobaculum xanthum]
MRGSSSFRGIRHRSVVTLVAVGGAALTPGDMLAQEQSSDPLELSPIIVTAGSRDERDLLDTPNAVNIVGEEEVLRRQPSTYEELIGDQTGVTISGGPRAIAQEPNIRGFQDEQVAVRIDGARQNFNLDHRGRFFLDPDILKRVEILRGGSSTLYGSGALGGAILLESKDADDILMGDEGWGGRVKLGYSSQGDEFLTSATGAVRADAFDAIAFLAYRPMFSDIDDGNGDPILNSEIDTLNGLVKVGWQPSDAHRIELGYTHYSDNGDTPPNANAASTPETVVGRTLDYDSVRLGWDWAPTGSELVDLSVLAYYNDTRATEDRIADGRLDKTDYRTLGFEAVNRSRFDIGLPLRLTYGVETYRDRQEATRNGAPRPQAPDASVLFLAGFAQADIDVTETVTLTPGLRFDLFDLDPEGSYESRTEHQVSPRLGVSWRPVEPFQLYTNVARSFRAPSLTELYTDGVHFSVPGFSLGPGMAFTGNNVFVPAPDLDPERALEFEIGGRYDAPDFLGSGGRLSFSGNVYFSRVDDFVDTQVTFIDFSTGTFNPGTGLVEFDGTTRSENVDADLWGFEADVTYDAGLWFTGAGLTIPRGRNRSGGALASIPQDRLVLTAGVRPVGDVEIGGRATFADGQDDVPAGSLETPGYAVFDVFANWVPTSGPFEGATLAAGIDNLTDRQYRIHPNGLNQPGLTFKLGVSYDF